MKRINDILENHSYQVYLQKNKVAEADRCFCHHDMGHFLDVARLAMILNQKQMLGIEEEWIYAAALLHDIGRWKQYEDGTRHEIASYQLAGDILDKSGFNEVEKEAVLSAILHHRNAEKANEPSFEGLLYRADKMSRSCFACDVQEQCNWKEDKKNLKLIY